MRQYIIDNAGVTYPKRDGFDTRVINDVMNEPPTGRICGLFGTPESTCLNNFNDAYVSGTAPTDSDSDGMPDLYESANGLNPSSPADGPAIVPSGPNTGYSNLEVYLNQIVGGPVIVPGPVTTDVSVPCIDHHTFAAAPSIATCDHAFGIPKGALILASMAVSAGETGNNARLSLGATDGTAQYTNSVADLGGGAPTAITGRRFMTDQALAFITETAAVDGEYAATGTPFTADAVTFTSSDPVTTSALSKVVMFGGNDLQVKVGTFTASATIGGTVVVPVGFLADLVLVFGNRSGVDAVSANIFNCVGAAVQVGGVVTQASLGYYSNNGAAAATLGALVEDRYACALFDTTAKQAVELSAFTTSGFTATSRIEAISGLIYGYMAFALGGAKVPFLQVINSPTAPAVVPYALPGMTPEFALLLMSLAQATRTGEIDSDANAVGIGVMTAAQGGTVGYVAQDGDLTMNSLSFVDGSAVRLNSNTTTVSHEATVPVGGMSADTLSLNYTVATSPARKWILVGWGAPVVAPVLQARTRLFTW